MPTPFTGEVRPLPYPLDRAVSLTAEVPDATGSAALPAFPDDPDEVITVFFRWSLNNFVAMATAIDVGDDPAYGADAPIIWWIWATSIMADFCAEVANCIETSEAVEAALAAKIASSPSIQSAITNIYNELGVGGTMNAATRSRQLTGANDGCDLNKLWGFIAGGIDGMNANNIDAQQSTELISNIFERAALVVGAIPGIGILPVDEVVQYAQGLWSDELFEVYEANDTTEYRNTLKCDVFCLAQANDCKVTIDLLRQYFLDRLSFVGDQTVDNVVQFLIDGVWTGTQVNDTFYLAQIIWMQNGNKFFKIQGVMSFSTLFALGEPSDDWELLCEECPECNGDFVVTEPFEQDGDSYWQDTEESLTRLDIPPATAFGVRLIFTFATPRTSADFDFTWVGAHDGLYSQLGDGTVDISTDEAGHIHVTSVTPSTTLTIDGGYAGSPSFGIDRHPVIANVIGCE